MSFQLPLIYLLPTHLPQETLHKLEERIRPNLTYDITEAKLIIGKVTTKQRALFELRCRKLFTEEVTPVGVGEAAPGNTDAMQEMVGRKSDGRFTEPPTKKRRIGKEAEEPEVVLIDSSTDSEVERHTKRKATSKSYSQSTQSTNRSTSPPADQNSPRRSESQSTNGKSEDSPIRVDANVAQSELGDTVKVLKLGWLMETLAAGAMLPFGDYFVYEGRPTPAPRSVSTALHATQPAMKPDSAHDILDRAKADAPSTSASDKPWSHNHSHTKSSQTFITRPTHLLQQTTSEHDNPAALPSVPSYLHTTYSCQRPTPLSSPNDPFLRLLTKIKTARILTGDEIGVRAYSTSIATLAAYPHLISSPQEILGLPGCDQKIAALFQEYKISNGRIQAVEDLDADPRLQVLRLFYEIWGVGAVTARQFYEKGWRDLDDVIEYGWSTLSRVQQIGVKYYDEFLDKIPRDEVASIGNIILSHANAIHPGFHMVIVGGYRRGKLASGDVDVVLSHPNETATLSFVQHIVDRLEKAKWITNTLTLSTANSERGQTPVSYKGEGGHGTGFDTLDKALVVWQDVSWPTHDADVVANPKAKNPAVHRRVDIIISPWRTAGCAVMGWSGGTTFQRDLRRYAKTIKALKFDSSGIRSREDGEWVDFEGVGGPATDMIEAEKKVFQGLGLEYREPGERCTG